MPYHAWNISKEHDFVLKYFIVEAYITMIVPI